MPETRTQRLLANFRHSLAYIDALPQLTLLGLIIGLFTGVIIVIFRLLIDLPLSYFLDTRPDNFEAMPTDMIWLLIMGAPFLSPFCCILPVKSAAKPVLAM